MALRGALGHAAHRCDLSQREAAEILELDQLGEPWVRLPWPVSDTAWTLDGLVDGHLYEFRVQSAKGAAVAEDLYSNVVTVRPGPPLLPALPAPLLTPAPGTPP